MEPYRGLTWYREGLQVAHEPQSSSPSWPNDAATTFQVDSGNEYRLDREVEYNIPIKLRCGTLKLKCTTGWWVVWRTAEGDPSIVWSDKIGGPISSWAQRFRHRLGRGRSRVKTVISGSSRHHTPKVTFIYWRVLVAFMKMEPRDASAVWRLPRATGGLWFIGDFLTAGVGTWVRREVR